MTRRAQAGDPPVLEPHGCTACDEDCTATFRCAMCGVTMNTCWNRVGGFEAQHDLCCICQSRVFSESRKRERRRLQFVLASRRYRKRKQADRAL